MEKKGFKIVEPLKRLIQNEILNPLAKKIIAQEFKAKAAVHVDLAGNEVVFR